jgi:hypothetical protein
LAVFVYYRKALTIKGIQGENKMFHINADGGAGNSNRAGRVLGNGLTGYFGEDINGSNTVTL